MNTLISKLPPNKESRKKWAILCPPKFRPCLEGLDYEGLSDTTPLSFGASINDTPVALIVATGHPDLFFTEVHSISCSTGHEETLFPLISAFDAYLKEQKTPVASFELPENEKIYTLISSILEKLEWKGPRPFLEKYFFDCYTFAPYWFLNPPRLPSGYSLFPWSELKAEEKLELQRQGNEGRFSSNVSPFGEDEADIFFENSLGLKYMDEVIGWSVTHKVGPGMIRYSTLYIDRAHAFLGPSVRLLAESIKLQQKSSCRWSYFELNLTQSDLSWIKFCRKRLAPHTIEVVPWPQFWKAFE